MDEEYDAIVLGTGLKVFFCAYLHENFHTFISSKNNFIANDHILWNVKRLKSFHHFLGWLSYSVICFWNIEIVSPTST